MGLGTESATLYALVTLLVEKGVITEEEGKAIDQTSTLVTVLQEKNIVEDPEVQDRQKSVIEFCLDLVRKPGIQKQELVSLVGRHFKFLPSNAREKLIKDLYRK